MNSTYRIGFRRGFTLVELLIAMTITLLLMAALGKAFAVIGRTMKEGRSQVSVSGKLRGLSFRVRTDLRSRTVEAEPPIKAGDGQGYFLYYEGPFSEQTAALFAAERFREDSGGEPVGSSNAAFAAVNTPTYARHSRLGDVDDYLAFTAKAPADGWFTGKVPAYLVEDNPVDPMAPRIIRSKYAEIVIWASPEWAYDSNTQGPAYAASPDGMPLYVDNDLDNLPDSITLHQRVLLIRPDLNINGTVTGSAAGPDFESGYLRPVNGVGGPANVPAAISRVYPIANPALLPAQRYYPSYVDPSSLTNPAGMFNSHWLVGMTPVHHFFDLSLRRIVHPVTGEPTEFVAANTLEDLAQPHNRFGHVRYPGRYFGMVAGGVDTATSMPLLALAWNDSLLNPAATPPWSPIGYPSPLTLFNAGGDRTSLFNGWLLPHFSLGDPSPPVAGVERWQRGYLTAADSRWDRTGEDIMAANVLAFDVKGFDASAPVFLTSGLDNQPGRAAFDDDGSGDVDVNRVFVPPAPNPATQPVEQSTLMSELGAVGSDDVLVRVGDVAIERLIQNPITDPRDQVTWVNGGTEKQMLASTGDFVDLLYPYQAGGPLLDLTRRTRVTYAAVFTTPPNAIPTPPAPAPAALSNATEAASARNNYRRFFESDLSGWPLTPQVLSSIKSAGKLFHSDGAGNIAYMQPCYDTWTDAYESDGFDQTASSTGALQGTNGTVWVLKTPSGAARIGPVAAPEIPFAVDTGLSDPTKPESLPPFGTNLRAVKISIRLEDPATEHVSEVTVIEDLLD